MNNPELSKLVSLSDEDTYTPRAALATLGLKLTKLDLFGPVRKLVHIEQKTVKYSPDQKLYAAFIAILAGGKKLVELNKLIRADVGLRKALPGVAGAEQSVVQVTLDECSIANVEQMYQAFQQIFRTYSQAYRHDCEKHWQLFDVDMTGAPCGKKAALATKGYFSNQRRNRRGRQIGRVLATHYKEIVVDRLYPGTVQLNNSLQKLVEATDEVLSLAEPQRSRTVWRVDAGGGSLGDVNWLLNRGYQVHCKDYSSHRARQLTTSVQEWWPDPLHSDREVGWVILASSDYARPVKRLALRFHKANGQLGEAVIISTLPTEAVVELAGERATEPNDPRTAALAYAHFYDQRGGGTLTEFKEDKQGLGLSSRNKKRYEGQAMLVQLAALAHNVLIWARGWLSESQPKLKEFGLKRWVRDILTISGVILFNPQGTIWTIILNGADKHAKLVKLALTNLLSDQQIVVVLGQI